MARKRYHNSQRPRQSPGSERSYHEYLISTPAMITSRAELVRMLRGGEDTYLELKVRFSNVEKLIAEIIALANTDGGAVVFGVNDQLRIEGVDDPEYIEERLREICTQQIQPPVFPFINKVAFDSGRRIVILEVEPVNRPHRTLDDRFYMREGAIKRETTREELSKLFGETHLTRFEQVPVLQSMIEDDIDESLFWSYIRGVNPGYWGESTKGFPTDTILRDMGLAVKIGDELIATIAGLMLFGRNQRLGALLPAADLITTRFSGRDHNAPIVEQAHLQGTLFHLFDGAFKFITRYVDLWDARPSRKIREGTEAEVQAGADQFMPIRANYPRGTMIEALTNSLIHRDWSARDRQARINIYDESIELINPAQTVELPMISLRYGISQPHNPRIKAVFTNRHYGLPCVHGGVPMIFEEAIAFARRTPEGPSITNGLFRLKIYGLR